jgi:chemotaxis protein methyltransferase CheR
MTTFMTEPSRAEKLEDLEIDLLLEGIRRRYGVDLTEYDRRFIRQRVRARLREEGVETASHLLERVLRRQESFEAFLDPRGGEESALFRPVRVWRALRQKAVPALRTYPSVRAWVVGPSSNDDLVALLVLLEEELSRNYTVYATEPGDWHGREARFGSIRAALLRSLSRSYAAAGGRRRLSEHVRTEGARARLLPELRNRVVFGSHNLATDASFNEFHLILVRSSLSRFSPPLRERSLRLMHGSLVRFGFLLLGPEESPGGTPDAESYRAVVRSAGLYQKVAQ